MIKVENLFKHYSVKGKAVAALDGVSLSIGRGEFVAVTGPSGSGKSTLLNILGLLDRPESGEYRCAGVNTAGLGDAELSALRGGLIGFVFQAAHALPQLTALENVCLPTVYSSVPDERRALECLAEVELAERAAHRPGELSGGQQQRMAIARAMVNRPLLLLADEPTGNLDAKLRDEILSLFARINASGVTVVVVTHDPAVVAKARRVITIENGKVVADTGAAAVPEEKEKARVPAARRGLGRALLRQHVRMAFDSARRAKLRSLVVFLCFTVGIGAVTLAGGLGGTLRKMIFGFMDTLDPLVLDVTPDSSAARSRLSASDAETLLKKGKGIEAVYVASIAPGKVSAGGKELSLPVYEMGMDRLAAREMPFSSGGIPDSQGGAVLGAKAAAELFGKADGAAGGEIAVNGRKFKVAGVISEMNQTRMRMKVNAFSVLVPASPGSPLLPGAAPALLEVKLAKGGDAEAAARDVTALLGKAHGLTLGQARDFSVLPEKSLIDGMKSGFKYLNIFLYSMTSLPIFLGGVAVMSVMLLSVSERRAEIGLRKAIGARNNDIRLQFIIETIVLCAAGGAVGIVLGVGGIYAVSGLMGIKPVTGFFTLAPGIAALAVSGVIFCLWPAQKAASVQPVESLRA